MKKILGTISVFLTMLMRNALAVMPKGYYEPIIEESNEPSWGIVIGFIAIVLVMLLIKIRINKKK